MKNKIAVFLSLTILFSCFLFIKPAEARYFTKNEIKFAFIGNYSSGYAVFGEPYAWPSGNFIITVNSSNITTNYQSYRLSGNTVFETIADAITWYNNMSYVDIYDRLGGQTFNTLIILSGSITVNTNSENDNYFGSLDDYYDSLVKPWYVELWDDFKDFVSDLGLALLTPFDPNSIIDIADWFENAWTVKVGEGEDDLLNQIEVVTPTPVPPSPTPIPYQTVIVPDGNGGSIIQYKYLNPSGTPIITDQPPQQNVTVNNNDDDGFEYPYYENPENKDNPFKFKIPWYLKLVLKHNDIDIDTLDDHYQVAQNQVQSDEVVNAVNEVYNGFQVLPSDWLLLLGAIASIPLFAALIHRFLQG